MRNNLYDNFNRLIGYTQKFGNETHIYDNLGRFAGKYVEESGQVFDNFGRLIGKGFGLLGILLRK